MAKKEFTLKITKSAARGRRSGSATGQARPAPNGPTGASSGTGDGHTHANKSALDKLDVTEDGYVTVAEMGSGADAGLEARKAKAGHADTATTADEAKTLTEDSEVWDMFVSRLKDDVVKGNITFERR